MNSPNQILKNVYSRHCSQLLASESPISRWERVIVFLIFAIFASALCKFQLVNVWSHNLDSAFLMEAMGFTKETGVPTTYLGPAFLDAHDTFFFNAETLCKADLISGVSGLSILGSHAYYIAYPLAALTWLFPAHVILAVANGLGFASFIYILYWIMRRQGVPILGAIAFCVLTMAHPVWAFAPLGDFYLDRLFIPLGLLFAALLYDAANPSKNVGQRYLLLALAVGLLAASITERAAIMIAFITLVSLVIYRKEIPKRGVTIVAIFSLALLVYVFLWIKLIYVQHNATASQGVFLQKSLLFFERLGDPVYASQVREFLVINICLFGIFTLVDWRLALIAAAALLPNLLVSTGGAEKNGWGTHYHSLYFPFLVFVTAIGFNKLWFLLKIHQYRLILVGLLLALVPFISKYSPGYGGQDGMVTRLYNFYVDGSQSYERYRFDQLQQVALAVPAGAKVTTLEMFMPILYRDRTISYYPIGIDTSQYAVLSRVTGSDGLFYYAGAVSYAGESKKADICLTERLRKAGYNVDQPKLLIGNIAVLERQKK